MAYLLPLVGLDGFLDLFLDRLDVEARWRLHRRKINGRLCEFTHVFLHEDEAPDLARHEVVHIAAAEIVQVFAADGRGPLEGVLTEIDDRRHVGPTFSPGQP